VYVDRSSRIQGYCLAVWSNGHVAEPTELALDAANAYWQEVLALGRAVSAAVDPVKINFFTLGNTVPHLHTHVVPRFVEDPAPGGPLSWDQVVGSPRFSERELRDQAALLRAKWSLEEGDLL
jgi:diadenosine tetraphosphate (Ap4A) HIT family hydrolase